MALSKVNYGRKGHTPEKIGKEEVLQLLENKLFYCGNCNRRREDGICPECGSDRKGNEILKNEQSSSLDPYI